MQTIDVQNEDLDQTDEMTQDEMTQQETHDHPPIPQSPQNPTVEAPQSDFAEPTAPEASAPKTEKHTTHNNSGNMFKNDRKSKAEHPDITGSVMVAGLEYYVSGWRKNGQKGDFYSLSFRPKDTVATASDLI